MCIWGGNLPGLEGWYVVDLFLFNMDYVEGLLLFIEDICIHELQLRRVIFYWEADFFFSCFGLGSEMEGYEVYFRGKLYIIEQQ